MNNPSTIIQEYELRDLNLLTTNNSNHQEKKQFSKSKLLFFPIHFDRSFFFHLFVRGIEKRNETQFQI